jgi:hypothetical protein
MDLRETGCEDGTGSGSCPVAGSGISGVEPSGSATREILVIIIIIIISSSSSSRSSSSIKLHNGELHNLYSLLSIIRMTKLRDGQGIERIWKSGMRIGWWWESKKERNY